MEALKKGLHQTDSDAISMHDAQFHHDTQLRSNDSASEKAVHGHAQACDKGQGNSKEATNGTRPRTTTAVTLHGTLSCSADMKHRTSGDPCSVKIVTAHAAMLYSYCRCVEGPTTFISGQFQFLAAYCPAENSLCATLPCSPAPNLRFLTPRPHGYKHARQYDTLQTVQLPQMHALLTCV